jgi:hypothetical protein
MRNRFRDAVLVIATAAVVASGPLAVKPTAGQPPGAQGAAPQPRRTADRKPDFSGIWQANSTANWDLQTHEARPIVGQPGVYPNVPVLAAPVVALGSAGWIPPGLGIVDGDEIPYQPWAAQRKRENAANSLDRDPELKCYMPGVPRAMYLPYPFQIVQSTNKIMMVFEFANAQRTIHLDDVEPYPGEAYMGHSVGRWDGDTLVVDVSSFTPYTWFDRSGNFHSDALHVVERYTPISRDAILYEATIEDSKVFTRPWKISVPLYRRLESNARIMDFKCIEMVEETLYGHLRKQPLVKRWEGRTMIVDITRKIPPGEEVYERLWSGNPPEEK